MKNVNFSQPGRKTRKLLHRAARRHGLRIVRENIGHISDDPKVVELGLEALAEAMRTLGFDSGDICCSECGVSVLTVEFADVTKKLH